MIAELDRLLSKLHQVTQMSDADYELVWGKPASVDELDALEQTLGCRLPASYRHFLASCGGGGLETFDINGLPDSANPVIRSVIDSTEEYRQRTLHPLLPHLVVIQQDQDDNEPFCLDTSRFTADECPVVLFYHQSTGHVETVAPNFTEFLARYLQPYLEHQDDPDFW